jgi:hypothetical protein
VEKFREGLNMLVNKMMGKMQAELDRQK